MDATEENVEAPPFVLVITKEDVLQSMRNVIHKKSFYGKNFDVYMHQITEELTSRVKSQVGDLVEQHLNKLKEDGMVKISPFHNILTVYRLTDAESMEDERAKIEEVVEKKKREIEDLQKALYGVELEEPKSATHRG